ncbi:MAG TPA: LysE family translocator [Nitrospirota bacterium]|nr:LysE family translocator [Nitrospirota bacterium]
MLSLSQAAVFITGAFIIIVIPGPNILYLIARSIHQGRLAGFISVLGIEAATLVHICAATLGLTSLLLSSAIAFTVVKYAGAMYLVYLGVRKLLERQEEQQEELRTTEGLKQVFIQGFVVNLLNPKTAMFFLAFLPQFVDAGHENATVQIISFGAILVVLALTVEVAYVLLSSQLRLWLNGARRFSKSRRYLAGGAYIGLGLTTALSGSSHK